MKVAVLGTGHLMHHVVPGMLSGTGTPHSGQAVTKPPEIRLSARSDARAQDLKQRFGLRVEDDNRALVAWADAVIIAVRPQDVEALIRDLPWKAGQIVISFAATVGADVFRKYAPGLEIVLGMPNVASEFSAGTTVIYPDNPVVRGLMEPCGDVIALASEADYEIASLFGAYYGWIQALTGEMSAWAGQQGLEPGVARQLVAGITRSAATRILQDKDTDTGQLVADLSSPGTLTGDGVAVLRAQKAFDPWRAAAGKILARIRN